MMKSRGTRAAAFVLPLALGCLALAVPPPASAMKQCLAGLKCNEKPDPCFYMQMLRAFLRESAYRSDWLVANSLLKSPGARKGDYSDIDGKVDSRFNDWVNKSVDDRIGDLQDVLNEAAASHKSTSTRDGDGTIHLSDADLEYQREVGLVQQKLQELQNEKAGKNDDGSARDSSISNWNTRYSEAENEANDALQQMGMKLPKDGCPDPPTFATDPKTCDISISEGMGTTKLPGTDAKSIMSGKDDPANPLNKVLPPNTCVEFVTAAIIHEETHRATCLAKKAANGAGTYKRRGRAAGWLPTSDTGGGQALDTGFAFADDEANAYMNEAAALETIQVSANDEACKRSVEKGTIRFEDVESAMNDAMSNMPAATPFTGSGKKGSK